MEKLCFVTYQFKTGGVERVFNAIATLLPDYDIVLLSVTNKFDSMIKNVPSTVKIIPLYNITYFRFIDSIITNCKLLSPVFYVILLISEIIYLRLSSKYAEYTFVNSADTISTLLVAYFGSHKKNRYSWIHCNPKTIDVSRYSCIYKWIYRRMHKIVCICKEQKKLLLEVVPGLKADKISVIYNPLDYGKIAELMNEPVPVDYDYMVMVARFDFRSKDFYTIIDAYGLISDDIKAKLNLVFVGGGQDENEVKNYTMTKVYKNNIIFVGMQDNPYKWIKHSKILVHSSRSEGLPTVLLEAMACGTPIIATDCETGVKEILDNGYCGCMVKVGDTQGMADAITRMMDSKELREEYVRRGYEHLSDFSSDKIITEVRQLWKD